MTDQTDQKDDPLFQGPTIDASGRLEGRLNSVESNHDFSPPPREESLELEARPLAPVEERIEDFRPDAPKPVDQRRTGGLKVVVAALALGVVALAAFLVFKPNLELPERLTAAAEAPPIIISSTPTGATITIGGKEVGQTPWAGDNRWVGQPTVTLKRPGYKTWEGKLEGGEPQTLDITLKK